MEVLEDDRLYKNRAEVTEANMAEMESIDALPFSVWSRLASSLGGADRAHAIRSDRISAAHVSLSFIDRQVSAPFSLLFFSLAHGVVVANFAELALRDFATILDPTALQIHGFLKLGYNRVLLEEGVRLLAEVLWSTIQVEQAHGSTACIHRLHSELEVSTLCCRSMLQTYRHLFAITPEASQKERVERRNAMLEGQLKRPVIANIVFFVELLKEAEEHTGSSGFLLNQQVMAEHRMRWPLLSLD